MPAGKQYVGEPLIAIGQKDLSLQVTPQIETDQAQPKNQRPVSGPIHSHRASVQAICRRT